MLIQVKRGVCGKSVGCDVANSTTVKIGEAVGGIAAQAIGEPGTHLTMRTFHIGGAAQLNEQSNLDAVADGHMEYRDMPTIKDSRGRRLSLARNGELAIIAKAGREREVHRLPYDAQIDRKGVVHGKCVSSRVNHGGSQTNKKKI